MQRANCAGSGRQGSAGGSPMPSSTSWPSSPDFSSGCARSPSGRAAREQLLQPPLDADTEERLDALKAALEVVDLTALPDLVRLCHDGGLDGEQRVVDDRGAGERQALPVELGFRGELLGAGKPSQRITQPRVLHEHVLANASL